FVNIGAGLGISLGAFNIHAMTDNLLALFNPFPHTYVTVQFGINFKFGCGEGGGGGGKSKKFTSVPCPSFGHSPSNSGSIPCASGKRR
ncbi:MAG: hypothetical protein LBQ70_01230, partial [Prevotellaceae bacterium]|nr:hypothetical protein [Prevotellaceae bacterium]